MTGLWIAFGIFIAALIISDGLSNLNQGLTNIANALGRRMGR